MKNDIIHTFFFAVLVANFEFAGFAPIQKYTEKEPIRAQGFASDWVCHIISNGNRTEWSPIRSVIIRVITKLDDREAGVQFVNNEYDYRPNWTTRGPIAN